MKALKEMIGTLAQSVQSIAARQGAPAKTLNKSVALISELELLFQQRCLKRERDGDAKKQGITKWQKLLDELRTDVVAAASAVQAPTVSKDPSMSSLVCGSFDTETS